MVLQQVRKERLYPSIFGSQELRLEPCRIGRPPALSVLTATGPAACLQALIPIRLLRTLAASASGRFRDYAAKPAAFRPMQPGHCSVEPHLKRDLTTLEPVGGTTSRDLAKRVQEGATAVHHPSLPAPPHIPLLARSSLQRAGPNPPHVLPSTNTQLRRHDSNLDQSNQPRALVSSVPCSCSTGRFQL
jgi:hypothetical protein